MKQGEIYALETYPSTGTEARNMIWNVVIIVLI